jgi:hypothetical protein
MSVASRWVACSTGVVCACLTLLLSSRVEAEPETLSQPEVRQPRPDLPGEVTLQGWVVGFDGPDVVIDLGTKQGLESREVVELWRPVKLKHPVTGRVVTDRFLIGTLRVNQVRERLSWARVLESPERQIAVGDMVILRKKAPEPQVLPPSPPAAKSAATPPGGEGTPFPAPAAALASQRADAQRVAGLFAALAGKPPEERAAAYERLAPVVAVRFRQALLERLYQVDLPETVRPDKDFVIALWMPGRDSGAMLHLRNPGQLAYHPIPMQPTGEYYYQAVVPGRLLEPRRVQLFIERVDSEGRTHPLLGSAAEPEQFTVRSEPDLTPESAVHASAHLSTDYADWNRLRGNDYAWQTEGDLGLRLRDTGIRALRTGFGVYRGKGGTVNELDREQQAPRSVGLTYGFLETEVGFSTVIALLGRAAVGLGDTGVEGGAHLYLRFGHDQRTNLRVGGEILGGIGLRAVAELELQQFELVPLLFRSEVTNQPAGSSAPGEPGQAMRNAGEVGVRMVGQVGYRVLPELTLALRGSYQGRNIRHAGPGGGAAVSYCW